MAKLNPHELFIKTFRTFNLERYKDSRVDKPRFQGLQLSEVELGAMTVAEGGQTVTIGTLSSASRRFTATEQSFIKAHIGDTGVSAVLSTAYPYEDVVTMKALSEPGLVAYMNTGNTKVLVAVVFSEGNTGVEADVLLEVQSILTLACNYEIGAENISITASGTADVWNVHVNCDTIYADILAVRSEVPTLDIPVTDYGSLAAEMVVPNPYPPEEVPAPQ